MKTNEKRSIILIENPFTGNESVAKGLGMDAFRLAEKWALPAVARKAMSTAEWKAATKMVLVRDPKARFEAAATYAVEKGFDPNNHPEFNGLLVSMMDTSAVEKGRLFLSFLTHFMEQAPVYLQPQSQWLTCKYDVVLSTLDIAEYFNKEVGRCCVRSNHMRSNRSLKASHVTADEVLLRSVYADDIDLFSRLKVWSPSPVEIRLVSGPCKRCMEHGKKLLELIEPNQLGGADGVPELHERANDEPVVKTRKRKKPQADVVKIDIANGEG